MTRPSTPADFWRRADRTPGFGPGGDCWSWTGCRAKEGYGKLGYRGRAWLAHRLAYVLIREPVEPSDGYNGVVVCHSCDQPWCVNPEHLFAGHGSVNQADKMTKKRHAHGVTNAHAKLTDELVKEIRRTPGTNADVASAFDVGTTTVSYVRNRKTWKHVV